MSRDEGGSPSRPWESLTSVDRVLEIHGRGLVEHGGLSGPAGAASCVEAALGGAYSAELYTEGRRHARAGLPFAAYVLVYLAKRHCFTDGNKRTAWASAADILAAMGLGVTATTDEAVDLVEGVITGGQDGADVARWLASRLFAL
jgi:death-on-curing protein